MNAQCVNRFGWAAVCCGALALLRTGSSFAQGTDEVERLKTSFARLDSIAWTGSQHSNVQRQSDNVSISIQYWLKAARGGGEKWASISKETGDLLVDGKPVGYSLYKEIEFNGRQALQINSSYLQPAYRRRYPDPTMVPIPSSSESMSLSGSLDNSPPFESASIPGYLQAGKLVFGYVEDAQPLADILSEAKVEPGKRLADLADCTPVMSGTPYGTYIAWLDSKHGFLPARIEARKSGRDKVANGTPLDRLPRAQLGSIWPTSQRVEVHRVIDNVGFAEFDGKPVIKTLRDTTTSLYSDGQRASVQHDFLIEEFHHPEPNAFSPTIEIPAKTTVNVFRDPHIKYVWREGKIVPDATPAAVQSLEGQSYAKEQNRTIPYLLVAANVGVVVFLLCWVIRRRWLGRVS